MKNLTNRILYQREYDTMNFQMGKMDALLKEIMEEPDINKAITLGRSMRGHVAVILKELHKIKREERK